MSNTNLPPPTTNHSVLVHLLRAITPLLGCWGIYSNSLLQLGYLPYLPLLLSAFFFLGVAARDAIQNLPHLDRYSTGLCLIFLITCWVFPCNLPLFIGAIFCWGLLYSYSQLGLIIATPLSFLLYQYPDLSYILGIPLVILFFFSSSNNIGIRQDWSIAIAQFLAGLVLGNLVVFGWNLSWAVLSPQPVSILWLSLLTIIIIEFKNIRFGQKLALSLSPAIFTFILSVIWLLLGFLGSELILGTFSPTQVGLSLILLYSACLLSLPIQKNAFLLVGLAIGLLSFWLYSSSLPPSFWILLLGCLGLLFSSISSRFFYGLAVLTLSFVFFTERKPNLDSPLVNLFYPKVDAPHTVSFFNRSGWWFRVISTESSEKADTVPQDGTIIENVDFSARQKEQLNEYFFASLLKHLPNDTGQITIGNDITGQFLSRFHHSQFPLININHPNPELLRQQAQSNPQKKALWLQPNIAIHPAHSEELIGSVAAQDLIVEIIHVPWPSPISPSLNRHHFQKLSHSIHPDGTVALILHLNSIPEYSFLPITAQIEEHFEHVQYWLPKNNVDSILILGRHKPLRFQALKQSIESDNQDPYPILSSAFATSLPSPTQTRTPTPQLYPAVPILHVGALSSRVQKPSTIWSDLTDKDQRLLAPLLEQKSHFLSMIQKAAQGNMNEVLQQAQNALEESALQSLISPHLAAAKQEIARAQQEGQSSEHWAKAQQFASTAQLISPDAVEPWLLQGEIAIGEGFLELGKEKFQKALTLAPNSLVALNGLARIAGLQQDLQMTEQYLQRALTHHPNNWITLHNLAVFYQENGNLSAAEKYAQKAIPLSSQHEKPQIALINIHIAQEKWTLALTEVDRLLAQKDSAFAWYLRGRIHFALQIWDKAEEDFRRATLSDPNLHAARGSIGLVRIAQGDKEGALQAFQATLKFDPNNDIARKNIQQLQLELDR